MNIKKILAAGIICTTVFGITAMADDIKINVNGEYIETDTSPVIENDRVLVPVRAISESLNCDVAWDVEKRAVSVFNVEELALLWIDKDTAFKTDGAKLTGYCKMDTPPKIINDRTMVPIRAISELLGADVDWDNEERTVLISYEDKGYGDIQGILEDINPVYLEGFTDMYDAYCDYIGEKQKVTLAEIELENSKIIKLELYNELAPVTVENFVKLAKEKAFDGKIFHRAIKDFIIQGGCFNEEGEQQEAKSIFGEFTFNGWLNVIPHERGVISMARTNDPNSASNQFFIMHETSTHLDGQYAAFGRVTQGMEYVDEIANSETDSQDKPIENQVIKTVRIFEKV